MIGKVKQLKFQQTQVTSPTSQQQNDWSNLLNLGKAEQNGAAAIQINLQKGLSKTLIPSPAKLADNPFAASPAKERNPQLNITNNGDRKFSQIFGDLMSERGDGLAPAKKALFQDSEQDSNTINKK